MTINPTLLVSLFDSALYGFEVVITSVVFWIVCQWECDILCICWSVYICCGCVITYLWQQNIVVSSFDFTVAKSCKFHSMNARCTNLATDV